jgi:hypothetical protein
MASLFRSGHKALSQRNGYGLDKPAGVGIVFKSGPDEALFVKVCLGLCACWTMFRRRGQKGAVGARLKLRACGGQALADNGPAAVYGKIQVNDCLLKCV